MFNMVRLSFVIVLACFISVNARARGKREANTQAAANQSNCCVPYVPICVPCYAQQCCPETTTTTQPPPPPPPPTTTPKVLVAVADLDYHFGNGQSIPKEYIREQLNKQGYNIPSTAGLPEFFKSHPKHPIPFNNTQIIIDQDGL